MAMTLRKKTLLIIGVMVVGLIVILYAASQITLLSSFSKLEELYARRNVDRALYILSDALSTLNVTCDDWASWDDTCAFIENANEEYIESGLVDKTFIGLRLSLMLFVNSSGRIVFGKAFDLQNETEIPLPQSVQEHVSANDLLLRHPDTKSSTTGIVLLPEGPMLVASQPILTSKDEGPVRGTLIMGRYLTSTEIERLAGILRSSFTVCRFDDSQMPPDFREACSSLSEKAPIFTRPLSAESVAGYALLKDIYGKPCLVLRLDMPRGIYKHGQATLRFLFWRS
jgi:Predicted periplasmic ligand-binding sensor domain